MTSPDERQPVTAAGPTREMTPDEIVAEVEAMKPLKRKVTIYQSWPRLILERERALASRVKQDADVQQVAEAWKAGEITFGKMVEAILARAAAPAASGDALRKALIEALDTVPPRGAFHFTAGYADALLAAIPDAALAASPPPEGLDAVLKALAESGIATTSFLDVQQHWHEVVNALQQPASREDV